MDFNLVIPDRNLFRIEIYGSVITLARAIWMYIYSHGSKLVNKAESSVYSRKPGICKLFRVPDNCSVLEAEMATVLVFITLRIAKPH